MDLHQYLRKPAPLKLRLTYWSAYVLYCLLMLHWVGTFITNVSMQAVGGVAVGLGIFHLFSLRLCKDSKLIFVIPTALFAGMVYVLYTYGGITYAWPAVLFAAALTFIVRMQRSIVAHENAAWRNHGMGHVQMAQQHNRPAPKFEAVKAKTDFSQIHGMSDLKVRLKKAGQEIVASNKKGDSKPRNGILLSGGPGNGKTAFAEALAGELKIPYITVTFGDVASKWVNETTENVIKAFRDAEQQAPCLLFLDEIDSLIASRDSPSTNDETGRTTNAILTELVNVRGKGVVVVAATNYLDKLDAAAIREGRFDFKIEVTPPDREARYGLLRQYASQKLSKATVDDETLRQATDRWEGFSVKRILAVGETLVEMHEEDPVKVITLDRMLAALRRVQGRKGRISPDTKNLDDLILPAPLRQQLKTIAARMKDIERVERLGGTVPTGLLFFGPPGTGKTETARSLAKASGWAFLNTSGNDLIMDPAKMDKLVAEAADIRPCIVFIDEADDILADRRASGVTSVTNKLLAAMDGAQGKVRDVVYIAATNHPDTMDQAALRGGRFTEKVYFPLPDTDGLAVFITSWMAKSRAKFDPGLSADQIAEALGEGVSIANASAILQEAVNSMIGRAADDHAKVELQDIERAVQTIMA